MDEACQIWMRHVTPAIVPVHWWAEGPCRRMRDLRLLSAAPVKRVMSHTNEWAMSHESWVMSYTWMRHGLHLNKSWVIFEWDTNRLWRSHGSHTVCYEGVCRVRLLSLAPMNESWAIGWLRLVGSLKLLVSFAEYRLFHRALLQKRPVIWSSFTGLFCKRDLWFEGVYCM